jgi:predicted kinase
MKNNSKTTLILFCGLPGSGKTTLAKKLEGQDKGIRLCTDDWQDDLRIRQNDRAFHKSLQRRLYILALELLQHNQSVILEDGLWTEPERAEKLVDAKRLGTNTELHFFDLSFDEIWNRLKSRNQKISRGTVRITEEEIRECWELFQRPTPAELTQFDEVFIYKDDSEYPNS